MSGLADAAGLLAAIGRALARPPSPRVGEPDGDAGRDNRGRDISGRSADWPGALPGQQPCFPAAPGPDGGCVPPPPAPEEGCFPAGPFPSPRRRPT